MRALKNQTGMWIPPPLRCVTLISFALLFTVLMVVISVLYLFSNHNQGFATPAINYRYFWTYCPSTVFILISGFWSLVEANTKLLAPWRAMAQQPTTAAKSLLLDYTSEVRFVTLYTSLKNSDWDVFLAVAGTLSLNVLVILSTGLFTLQQKTIVDKEFPYILGTTIDDGYNSTLIDGSTNAFSTSYAIDKYGLPFPLGTTESFAYQSINLSAITYGATAYLEVDAFYPETECEPMKANWTFGIMQNYSGSNETFAGANYQAVLPDYNYHYFFDFTDITELETYQLAAFDDTDIRTSNSTLDRWNIIAVSMRLADLDIVRAVQNHTYEIDSVNTTGFPNRFTPIPSKMVSSSAAYVRCYVRPCMRRASLTVSQNTIRPVLLPRSDRDRKLNESLQIRFPLAIAQSINKDSDYLTTWNNSMDHIGPDLSVEKYSSKYAPFFQIMNNTNPRKSIEDVIDDHFLVESAEKAMELISAQIAAAFLLQDAKEQVIGELAVAEDRLIVNALTFNIMIGVLGVMIVMSLALCIQSKAAVPKSPSSIASIATILARSPGVLKAIEGIASSRDLSTKDTLISGRYYVRVEILDDLLKYSIKESEDSYPEVLTRKALVSHNGRPTWWHPWSTSVLYQAFALLLPISGVIGLEILLRYSHRSFGIVQVPDNEYVQYAWLYIPIFAIFCLNSLFNSISATNRTVQPYVNMHDEPSPESRSINLDLNYTLSLSALYRSISIKSFGVAAAIFATLLGSALPIAVSGLFTAHKVQQTKNVTLYQVNGFDASIGLASSNIPADALPLPALIMYNNLSYPQWTFGRYAIPQLDDSDITDLHVINGTFISTTLNTEVPAVIGVSNCSLVPEEDIIVKPDSATVVAISLGPDGEQELRGSFVVDLKLPSDCPRVSYRTPGTYSYNFYMATWVRLNGTSTNNTDLPSLEQLPRNTSAASYHGGFHIPPHCPLSVVYFARGTYNRTADNTSTVDMHDIKALHCWPHVQQERLSVDFILPDFDISETTPPVPVPGSRAFFSEAEILNTGGFRNYLPDTNQFEYTVAQDAEIMIFDGFFDAVFNGKGGILPSDLAGSDTVALNRFLERIDEVYGIIVAQIYGTKRRFATSPQNPAELYNGTITYEEIRIWQDKVSTRIIQGILAAMAVCALVSMILTNGRKVLPRNPCSIAAVASFLVHSSILNEENIPVGSEFLDQRELRKRGILRDGFYSFGWFGEGESRWYGIDLGKAEKQE